MKRHFHCSGAIKKLDKIGFSQFCKTVRALEPSDLENAVITLSLGRKKLTVHVDDVETIDRQSFQASIFLTNLQSSDNSSNLG
jgi:hypothetical protein